MTGSQFFGTSAGSVAATASSGQYAATPGPSCGSAGADSSPSLCGMPGQMIPTVTSQVYIPSTQDMVTPPACIVTHP